MRHVPREGGERAFAIIGYEAGQIENAGIDDSNIARQRFGRGLCVVNERLIAGGSSPSTISLYDLPSGQRVAAVNLSLAVSYTHLRAHETVLDLVCRLLLEKKKAKKKTDIDRGITSTTQLRANGR